MRYRVTRDVADEEDGNYSDRDIKAGEILYKCTMPQYGCVSEDGIGLTFDETGDYPFFEFPLNAVEVIPE